MNDNGANIDLLFRNGLKDFEVLPPADVWDGIKTMHRMRSRPALILRVAAAATILITAGYFTYRLTSQVSIQPEQTLAFNVKASSPLILPDKPNNQLLSKGPSSPETNVSEIQVTAEAIDKGISEVQEAPGKVYNFIGNREVDIAGPGTVDRSLLSSFNKRLPSPMPVPNYQPIDYVADIAPVKPQNRWSIEAMASPTYYSKFSSGNDDYSKQLMEGEQPLFSYSGGLGLSYKISKRFSIQSGLYYSSLGQKVEGVNSFNGFKPYDNSKGDNNFEVVTTNGTILANNPDVFLNADASGRVLTAYTKDVFDPKKASLQYINNNLTQALSYLELPVMLRYKLIDKTIGINLIGGLSYNLLVHNSVYTTVDGGKYNIGDTKGLNPLTLSSSLGMGMEYNFSNKLSLNLEPTFRYYLNPFNVATGSFIHPYSFGIFSGFSYKF